VATGWRAYDLAQVRARKRQPADTKQQLWDALLAAALSETSPLRMNRRLNCSLSSGFDYSEDWLEGFLNEFRNVSMV
jgi:hypothetical protein